MNPGAQREWQLSRIEFSIMSPLSYEGYPSVDSEVPHLMIRHGNLLPERLSHDDLGSYDWPTECRRLQPGRDLSTRAVEADTSPARPVGARDGAPARRRSSGSGRRAGGWRGQSAQKVQITASAVSRASSSPSARCRRAGPRGDPDHGAVDEGACMRSACRTNLPAQRPVRARILTSFASIVT